MNSDVPGGVVNTHGSSFVPEPSAEMPMADPPDASSIKRGTSNMTSCVGISEYVLRVRAARLITMMGLLQERGRMSASQLAETLEVSVRTVLRDVEALNSAGIHVHAHRGASGGFELDESATLVRTPTSVAHGRPTRTAEVLVSPHGRQVASLVGRPAGLRYRRRVDRRGWTAATMRFW